MNQSITEQLTNRVITELIYEASSDPPKGGGGDGGFGGLFGQEMYDPINPSGGWRWVGHPDSGEYRWFGPDGFPKEPPQGAPAPPKDPPGYRPPHGGGGGARGIGKGRQSGQQQYIDDLEWQRERGIKPGGRRPGGGGGGGQGGGGRGPKPRPGFVRIPGLGALGIIGGILPYLIPNPGPGKPGNPDGEVIAPPEQSAPQPTRYRGG